MQWSRLKSQDLFVGLNCRALFKSNPDAYAFDGIYLPVKIIAEYPKWWLVEVQPHKNPRGQSTSSPYRMTMRKWDVDHGFVIVKA